MDVYMIKDIDYRTISLLNAEQAHAFRVVPSYEEGNSVSVWGEETSIRFLPQLQLLLGILAAVARVAQVVLMDVLIICVIVKKDKRIITKE